jgi:hypothetical protein
MPIALSKSPRGHPTRWAKTLSRAPVDAIPATDVARFQKQRLRSFDAGLLRQYRRQVDVETQPLRDARLRRNIRGRGVKDRLPDIGVQIIDVHAQAFEVQTVGQAFSFMVNLGEAFAGRTIIIAFTNFFDSSSSAGNYNTVQLGGVDCTEEAVESGGSVYSLAVPTGTNARLSFNTENGVGILRVLLFNVRGSVLPTKFADAEDDNLTETIGFIPVVVYGALLLINCGPGYEEGTPGVNWTSVPPYDWEVIAAGDTVDHSFNDVRISSGAAWKQIRDANELSVTVTDNGLGGGSSFTNVGLFVLSIAPPNIVVDNNFIPVTFRSIGASGADPALVLGAAPTSGYDGNEEIVSNINIGGGAGRLLVFTIATQFFAGDDQGNSPAGATYNGTPLNQLSEVITGGYSAATSYWIVDPGFSSPGEFRQEFNLDPASFGFPISVLSIWSITGFDTGTPILDFADAFELVSDGELSVTLEVEETGTVVALAFGAAYSDNNLQTWDGLNSSNTFGFTVVYDAGSGPIFADDPAYVVTSVDDSDIGEQTGPEKIVLAVSIKPAAPAVYDIVTATVFSMSYSFTLHDLASNGAFILSPLTLSYTLHDLAESGANSISPLIYSYTLRALSSPPGFWFEEPTTSDTWTEQNLVSNTWTEQAPLSNTWTEES